MTWPSSCSVRTRVRCVSGTDGDQPRGGVRVCGCVCVCVEGGMVVVRR